MARSRASTDFTARWLDRVQPPAAGRAEYWDGIVHGLGLRVSATGHKTWQVLFRVRTEDNPKRIALGSYPDMSLIDAREAARAAMGTAKATAADDHSQMTVATMVKDYMAKCARLQLRDSSLKRVEQILMVDVVAVMGDRLAAELRRRDIIAWAEAIRDRGAPVQANRALRVLQRVYNWAISQDLLELNPCSQVKPVAQEHLRDRVLEAKELRALWRSLDDEEPAIAALFRLLCLTGQRLGEVRLMVWDDVDLVGQIWTIPAARAKNGRAHRVPLSPPAVAILKGLGWTTGPVIPGGDVGESLMNPYKAVDRIRKRSGIDFVPHDLRRTVATYMASLEIPEETIGKVMNHAAKTITATRYIRHPYDREKKEALDVWAERLMGIVG